MTAFGRSLLTPARGVQFAAIIVLCLLVWVGGVPGQIDLFPNLKTNFRLLIIAAIVLVWLALSFVVFRRRLARSARLFDSIRAGAPVGAPNRDDQLEIDELGQPLAEALAFLQEQGEGRSGRDFADILPWLLVMGLPGSGASAAVEQADLPMPLASRLGRGGIRTELAGGTRWWFAESGMLLRPGGTALRTADEGGRTSLWRGLLDFLVDRRPRRPIDGVVLAVDVERLVGGDALEEAATLRVRLQEAMRRFGTSLQAYLLVTKLDKLLGFTEFFEIADAEIRSGAFGVLLPRQRPSGSRVASEIETEFTRLCDDVGRDLMRRLSGLRDGRRRARASSFPGQLRQVASACTSFCGELTRIGRYDTPLQLRGVFLSSAGGPRSGWFDAWAPALGAGLGLRPPAVQTTGTSSPHFLQGFFNGIAFREAGLVGRNRKFERRLLLTHLFGYGACFAALVALGGLLLDDYAVHRGYLAKLDRAAVAEQRQVVALGPSPALSSVIPVLNQAEQLVDIDNRHLPFNPFRISEALSAAQRSYDVLLKELLLPTLARELAVRLRGAVDGGASRAAIRTLLAADLELNRPWRYRRDDVAPALRDVVDNVLAFDPTRRADALRHLDRLLVLLPSAIPIDTGLVAAARATLQTQTTAAEIYDRLKQISAANAPPLDVVGSLGSSGAQLLMLRAQARLPTVIPSLYTRQGFYSVFVAQAPVLARNVTANDWVVGPMAGGAAAAGQLLRQVSDLYVADYVRQWRQLLDQISLQALPDMSTITAALQTLSGVDSPISELVNLVRVETDLPAPAPPAPPASRAAALGAAVKTGSVTGIAAAAEHLDGSSPGSLFSQMPWPGDAIRTSFAPIAALGDARAGQSAVLRINNTLSAAYNLAESVEAAKDPGAAATAIAAAVISGQGTDQLIGLRVQAASLPPPISDMMRQLYSDIWSALLQLAADDLQAVWARDVDSVCEQTIAGRYPFVDADTASVSTDTTLADFAAFFSRGGVMDKFVSGPLALFVEPGSGGTLRLAAENGFSLRLSAEGLAQINRARRIRDLFFNASGSPGLRFFLTPVYLAPQATTASITIDNTTAVYRHDPPRTRPASWPPLNTDGTASISMTLVDGRTPEVATSGPWAWFRLLAQAEIASGAAPDEQIIGFHLDDLWTTWRLRATSSFNPFARGDLQSFRCVPRL